MEVFNPYSRSERQTTKDVDENRTGTNKKTSSKLTCQLKKTASTLMRGTVNDLHLMGWLLEVATYIRPNGVNIHVLAKK